ncbi:MAG TPA: acetamidase/formamidase family protein [Streptosporangiaceae bacterium]|nr:acetamidase/formamidase family protein [Streptosporangiaceae bacterium]
MAIHEIRIDPARPLAGQPGTGHNRWHPGIPPLIRVEPGDEVVIPTRDAVDGQITPASVATDVPGVDISVVHPLTGPVFVAGAEPGDLLEVDILEVSTASFGYTLQSPGFGFLRADFGEPFLARWLIEDGFAVSPDVPRIRIPGHPFMGTMGVAPSRELLTRITARERDLAAAGGMVDLPEPRGAVPASPPVTTEGLRTIPPRENAGNVDIKQLTAGTRLLIPVWVPGALFSAGDAHFAQGDGEACGQAIEVRGTLRARFGIRRGEAAAQGIEAPRFERTAPSPAPGPYFATTGTCVRADGGNGFEDLTMAARNALSAMIGHLVTEFGYTRQQAYVICSVAVDLKASQVVDLPNVLVSAFLPLGIFDD